MNLGHFQPASRAEWRAWLIKHYDTEQGIWLVLAKKHSGRSTLSLSAAVEEALCFGWIDGLLKRIDDESYALRFTPRRRGAIWSETNKARVKQLIAKGLMTPAGLAKVEEAKRNGEWRAAARREKIELPPAFEQALAREHQARKFFEKLAPSYRRQFIWWVASAKREETQQTRIRRAIELLKANKTLGTTTATTQTTRTSHK